VNEASNVIQSTSNAFGGVVVSPETLTDSAELFGGQLGRSLAAWKAAGHNLVWLEVPASKASLIPVAVESGFVFHHADESGVTMTRRLVDAAYFPPYATHYIGVGGVVLNDAEELLVVSERYRRRSAGPSYKLPGGALHPGEHLVDGVVREIAEETGVRTKFESVVCFRHWHDYRFGKSDIYFVCRLSPLSDSISRQVEEIDECRWMPVQEYLAADNVSTFNKRIVRAAMDSNGVAPTPMDGYDDHSRFEFFVPEHPIE
jgi:8-oxo-dGTP pyrophosphatase MutT (NUDIX family)